MTITAIDQEALERALARAMRDPDRAEQLQSMLTDTPRREVLEFASYHCQMAALRLKPWQSPPAHIDEDDPDERDQDGQDLLRKMLAAGVSRYEPSPLKALAGAKRRSSR
jgi:hypothetical protein